MKQNNPKEKRVVVIREGESEKKEEVIVEKNEKEKAEEEKIQQLSPAEKRKLKKRNKTVKSIKKVAIICVIAIFVMVIYINRSNFTFANISLWFQSNLINTQNGNGYPQDINGSHANTKNVASYNGDIAVLSDTSFTLTNYSGKEIITFLHNFENPVITNAENRYLIYDVGGTNYYIIGSNNTYKKLQTENTINCASISENGSYIVVTQPPNYTSQLNAYSKNGELKFSYDFASVYVNTCQINSKGNGAVVSAVSSKAGALNSTLYVFDFKKESSLFEYNSDDNLILDIAYNKNGKYYAVGDNELIIYSNDKFNSYSYANKRLTAYSNNSQKTIISLSEYEGDGACEINVFENLDVAQSIESTNSVTAISSYGSVFSYLTLNDIYTYHVNGQLVGQVEVDKDIKNILLCNESYVYTLSLKSIDLINLSKN